MLNFKKFKINQKLFKVKGTGRKGVDRGKGIEEQRGKEE